MFNCVDYVKRFKIVMKEEEEEEKTRRSKDALKLYLITLKK